ncbi:MAG: TolC family protein [Flavobacteriia bacterium]|nr:TolC family protein [Flavobacteriia bacterium]
MKKVALINFLILIAFASNGQTLDLESCLKMADTANLTIRNARIDIAMNKKQIDVYEAARLPKLNYVADYKYNAVIPGQVVPGMLAGGPPGTFTTVQFGVPWVLSNTMQLNQVVYNPQVNYGISALKINQEVVELQAGLTTQNIKYQVSQTYFNLQAVKKQIQFAQENLMNLDKLIHNMQALVDQKMVVSTEVDKLNITKLTLKNQEQTLIATKEKIENLLKILIGKDISDKIDVTVDATVEKSILVDANTNNQIELQLIDAQKRLNLAEKNGIYMAYLPSLAFYAAYNYSYNIRPESNYGKGINGAFLGLKLEWTLFDGFEKYNKSKVNKLNSEKINQQMELTKQQLDMSVENAKKQVEIQKNSLAISQEQLKLALTVNQQLKTSFEQGVISSNDLIKNETDLYQAQTNIVVAYLQLRQAELDLLKATGNIK